MDFSDFHIHTIYSDGRLTVDEVLNEAKKHVKYLAITDHDEIDGALEAYDKVEKLGLELILGVELSTHKNDEPVHVLGYFKNKSDALKVHEFLKGQTIKRQKRMLEMKDKLLEYFDIDLNTDRLMKRSCVTRGSIAQEIVRQGFPYTKQEIFDKLIGINCKAYVPSSKLTPEEGIKILKDAGAKVFLAHPVRSKKNDVEELIKLGFDGIEARYSINTDEDTKKYLALAKKYNLVVSAGSDFHYFDDDDHGDIGIVHLESDELEEFLKFVRG